MAYFSSMGNAFYQGNFYNNKNLARQISHIENQIPGYEKILQSLPFSNTPVIGITGPPGAGKSTVTNTLLKVFTSQNKKVAVVCIDPSSPFNLGAILGDRIRLQEWYTHPLVYIRSLASRGALGGLHQSAIEITDLLKASGFDYVIVETVGVGQSEIEIAGLADVTVLVLVPEAGDEIQSMKAGIMEIADIFLVNKADRPEADTFIRNLWMMLAPAFSRKKQPVPVMKSVATTGQGIGELAVQIEEMLANNTINERKQFLLFQKALSLIQAKKMAQIDKKKLQEDIIANSQHQGFNLYQFVEKYC